MILVIGAQNIDIFAMLPEQYTLRDSNISSIQMAFGGVGRNIAVNLKRLGNEVHFLTVFGDDYFSQAAKQRLEELNISTEQSITATQSVNSTYLAVMDAEHDLYLGLNDMKIIQNLTIEALQSKHSYILKFDYIVIDNNLEQEVMEYLVTTYQDKTIFVDAVSAAKVQKLKAVTPFITYLKANTIEAASLGINPTKGTMIVTNGANDITLRSNGNKRTYHPIPIATITNASGAGDAFFSGFIHGIVHDKGEETAVTYAKVMAYLTLQHSTSTNEALTNEEVETHVKLYRV